MTRVFISYSRDDRPFVDEFVPYLRRVYGTGSVWFDDEIHGGADWWAMILRQISSCDVFIYLLTPTSMQSEYCQAECREAFRLQKPILPIMVREQASLDLLPDDLQELIARIHYIELQDGPADSEGMAQVYGALRQLLEHTPDPPHDPLAPTPVNEPSVKDKRSLVGRSTASNKPGVIRGVVSHFEVSLGGAKRTFRLERFQDGKQLPPVPVEMRGYPFHGSISNGDVLEIDGRWKPGQVLRTTRAYNATLGTRLQAGGGPVRSILVSPFFLLLIIVVIIVIIAASSS